jgi:hypothetical protein
MVRLVDTISIRQAVTTGADISLDIEEYYAISCSVQHF